MGGEKGSSPCRRICGILRPASAAAAFSPEGCAPGMPASLTCSAGTASGSCSGAVTTGDNGCLLATGMGDAFALGLRTTRFLTTLIRRILTLPPTADSISLSSFGGEIGMMGEAFALGFRTTRFLTVFVLTATLGLLLATSLDFVWVLRLPPLALARLGLRRGTFGFVRTTRRTVRAAGFTAFPKRGFLVFIPGYDPFGRRRILSDVPYTTAAAWMVQREFALKPRVHTCVAAATSGFGSRPQPNAVVPGRRASCGAHVEVVGN